MSTDQNLFDEFPPVSRDEWEEVISNDLRGADYKTRLNWHTGEGIDALPFYRKDDLNELPSPILSGKNKWEVRQPISEQDITKANSIGRKALKRGADGLHFALQVRQGGSQLGGDLQGVAIQHQAAFSALVEDIDLTSAALHFDCGISAPVILAMLHNECENRAFDSSAVSGSLMYDPYAYTITNGQLPNDRAQFIDEARQMVDFCHQRLPNVRCLGIDASVYHRAGGTIVQELGYALATGSEYLAELGEAGIDTGTIASGIHFNFAIGSQYFLEIAKFRAARRLWRAVLDAYKVDESQAAYLHAASSGWNKTIYDPYVNMLRTTTEGMSAAIAGCDSITLHPFDEPFSQPDDFSRRTARNSQIVLKEEAYFDKVADPSAGSYYIETLTDKIAKEAWSCFQEVESQGGILKSIRGGYLQTAIEESRKERDRAIATRKRVFVGINEYPNMEAGKPDKVGSSQPAASLIETEYNFTIDHGELMTSLKNALQKGASLGDLMSDLSKPTKHDIRQIRPYRGPQAFEALRQATENHPKTPKVLTIPIGNKKMRKARSSFAINFFGCVGYEIEDPIGFDSVEAAMAGIRNEQPDIIVLCSSDKEYEELVPELCNALDKLEPPPIAVLAGNPGERTEEYRKAGIDFFIHAKCNVLETLRDFQKKLDVI